MHGLEQAQEHVAARREAAVEIEATLARTREAVEALAAATAELQVSLPLGLQEHFRPSARHLAETRGLLNNVLRRFERLESDLLAERHARIDDLQVLVDLIAAQWRSLNDRLDALAPGRLREVA